MFCLFIICRLGAYSQSVHCKLRVGRWCAESFDLIIDISSIWFFNNKKQLINYY